MTDSELAAAATISSFQSDRPWTPQLNIAGASGYGSDWRIPAPTEKLGPKDDQNAGGGGGAGPQGLPGSTDIDADETWIHKDTGTSPNVMRHIGPDAASVPDLVSRVDQIRWVIADGKLYADRRKHDHDNKGHSLGDGDTQDDSTGQQILPATPAEGDMILFDGAAWVLFAAPALDGKTYVHTCKDKVHSWIEGKPCTPP